MKLQSRVALFSDLIACIAGTQRLRGLVRRLHGDGDLKLAKKRFEATVKQNEDARHHFEHLDERVREIAPTGHGAFGGLSWWTATTDGSIKLMGVVPGTLANANTVLQTKVPRSIRPPVDRFTAVVGGQPYDVTSSQDALVSLRGSLAAWAERVADSGAPNTGT